VKEPDRRFGVGLLFKAQLGAAGLAGSGPLDAFAEDCHGPSVRMLDRSGKIKLTHYP